MFSMKEDGLLYEQVKKWITEEQNDKVKYILDNTVLTDLPNKTSFLHIAAENNNSQLIEYLINRGLDVDIRGSYDMTPLVAATIRQHWAAVATLIKHNADVLAPGNTGSALSYIGGMVMEINKTSIEIIQLFLNTVRSKSVDKKQCADILLKVGFDLDRLIYLHDAEVTKLYMKDMGGINAEVEDSAVEIAMRTMDEENMKVLLHYEDAKKGRNTKGHFVYHLREVLSDSRRDESLDVVVRMAVDKIVTWKFLNEESVCYVENIFHEAPEVCLRKVMDDRLLSYIKNDFNYDVRVHMFGNPNPCVFQMIKNGEVDANALSRKGRSALHIATSQNATENIKYLLDCGMNPNITDNNGKTPIFKIQTEEAATNDTLKIFLQHGADLQASDQFGKICIDYHSKYHERVGMTIIAHSAILEAGGVPLKESMRNFCSMSNDTLNYFLTFRKQVEEMKVFHVYDSLTLFEVLSVRLENLIRRVRPLDHKINDDFFISNSRALQNFDSYYRSTLRDRLIKAVKISNLRQRAAVVICESIEALKPYDLVIEKICNFLSYYDLHVFEQ